MEKKSDKLIWKQFKNKSEDALSYIYRQNIDFLFYYGKRFTTEEELILDVIQDLFFYLIRKRDSLGDTENIRMYLLKSFRRNLFIELKKKNKQQNIDQISDHESEFEFSIEDEIINNEKESEISFELKRNVQKLNTKQREILYYKFSCDFDYDQICDIMSITYDSARQMVSRAINTLKKMDLSIKK